MDTGVGEVTATPDPSVPLGVAAVAGIVSGLLQPTIAPSARRTTRWLVFMSLNRGCVGRGTSDKGDAVSKPNPRHPRVWVRGNS